MLWTNSDMIYFQDMINTIYSFKINKPNEKKYLLIGQRIDWHNPKKLEKISKNDFFEKINFNNKPTIKIEKTDSLYNECSLHAACGIDYVIHSKTTFLNNLDPNLVIAGTRHDMIMVGVGIDKKYFTCDITNTCPAIHQNHDYKQRIDSTNLFRNNLKCSGKQCSINDSPYKSIYINEAIQFAVRH
tara:strand:- start:1637 stop:2194 length:558 start_codon:yes stop_codon:yes gene_type:complete